MDYLERLAEEKINKAIKNGELDNLPGQGKPIPSDELSMVPEELRTSFRILKNAGVLPPEMELKKEMVTLEELIRCCTDDERKTQLKHQLNEKTLRYHMMMEQRKLSSSSAFTQYRDKIINKLK